MAAWYTGRALVLWIELAALPLGCAANDVVGTGQGQAGGTGGGAGAAGTAGQTGTGEPRFERTGHGLPGAAPDTWTYLVYMLPDNDLEPFLEDRLSALMQVGSGGGLTVLLQLDRAPLEAGEPLGELLPYAGAQRLRVERDRLVRLQTLGSINSGASGTFAEFLNWGIQAAPADHYALVLWGHGGAWRRFGLDASHQNDGLSLSEITLALDIVIASSGLRGPLDLVGFDACLMGTWEVAVALEGRARYLLASEQVEPGRGYDQQPLALLQTGSDALALGRAWIDASVRQADPPGGARLVGRALTDLNQVSLVSEALAELVRALGEGGIEAHARAVGRSRATTFELGRVPRGRHSSMIDLREWSRALGAEDPALLPQVEALRDALGAAVVERVTADANAGSAGLSIYFPLLEELYEPDYEELAGVAAWRDFLGEFYDAARSLVTVPSFATENSDATVRAGTDLSVSGALSPGSFDDVATSWLDVGVFGSDGSAALLGEHPATLSPSGFVLANWDRRVIELSRDGRSEQAGYVIQHRTPQVDTLAIPLRYTDGGEVSTLVLLATADASGDVLEQGYYAERDGAWSERVPRAGSTLAALLPTLSSDGATTEDLPQPTTFDGPGQLKLAWVKLAEGSDVFVRLRVADYAGHGASADNAPLR